MVPELILEKVSSVSTFSTPLYNIIITQWEEMFRQNKCLGNTSWTYASPESALMKLTHISLGLLAPQLTTSKKHALWRLINWGYEWMKKDFSEQTKWWKRKHNFVDGILVFNKILIQSGESYIENITLASYSPKNRVMVIISSVHLCIPKMYMWVILKVSRKIKTWV